MKDPDIRPMKRVDLEDEVMLLRAQVKVLQDWLRAAGVHQNILKEAMSGFELNLQAARGQLKS